MKAHGPRPTMVFINRGKLLGKDHYSFFCRYPFFIYPIRNIQKKMTSEKTHWHKRYGLVII